MPPELYRTSLEYLDLFDPNRADEIRRGPNRKRAWGDWMEEMVGSPYEDWGVKDKPWSAYGLESPMTRFGQHGAPLPSQREETRQMSTSWYDEMAGIGDVPPARSNPPPAPPPGAFGGSILSGGFGGGSGMTPPGLGDAPFGGGGGGSSGGSYTSLGIEHGEASRAIGQVRAFMEIAREHAPDLAKMAESMRDVSRLTKEQITQYEQYRNIISPFGQMSQTFGRVSGAGDAVFAPGSPEARLTPHVSSAQSVIQQLSGNIQGFAEAFAQMDVGAPFGGRADRAANRWSILTTPGREAGQQRQMAFDEGLYDAGPTIGGMNVGRAGAAIAGGAARFSQGLIDPFTLYHFRILESMFINPVREAAMGYREFAAQGALGQFQAGQISSGELMQGQYGQMAQQQSRSQLAGLMFGQQSYQAWSPVMDAIAGPEAMSGIVGMGAAIGIPSAGVGLTALRVGHEAGIANAGRLGLIAAAGAGILGVAGYTTENATNYMATGRTTNAMQQGLGNLPQQVIANPAGVAGLFGQAYAYAMGTPTDRERIGLAPQLANFAQQWASGQMQNPYEAWYGQQYVDQPGGNFLGNGVNRTLSQVFPFAEALGGMQEQWVTANAAQLGVTPEQAQGMFTTLTRFGRTSNGPLGSIPMPVQPGDARRLATLTNLGYGDQQLQQMMGLRAQAMGVNPQNPNIRSDIFQDILGLMEPLGGPFAGQTPMAATQNWLWGQSQLAQINPVRRGGGLGSWDLGDVLPYRDSPETADFIAQQYTPWAAGRRGSMPGWSEAGPYGSAINAAIGRGDRAYAGNIMSIPNTAGIDIYRAQQLGFGAADATIGNIETASLRAAGAGDAEVALGIQRMMSMSPSTLGMSAQQATRFGANYGGLTAMGINPMQAAQAEMASTGAPNTIDNFIKALNDFTQVMGSQGLGAISTRIAAAPIRGEVNLGRMAAGRAPFSTGNGMNEVFADPVRGSIWAANDAMANDMAVSNPAFFAAAQPFYNQMGGMIAQGGAQMVQAQRMGGQFGSFAQAAQGYQQYGMSTSTAVGISIAGSMLSPANAGLAMNAANNNPYALSALANQGVLPIQFQSIDMQTGMPAFYDNISQQEYAGIQQSLAGTQNENRLGSYSMLSGGLAGLQSQMRVAAAGAAGAGLYWGNFGRNLTMRAQLGGGTLSPTGEVTGGDLGGLMGMFRQLGMPGYAGTGQGIWQIEDAQRGLSREMQAFQMEQQGRQIGIQGEQVGLQRRQFMERWDLNYERFQHGTAYQRQEMNIGRQQQVQQQQWGLEDFAFNRNQMDLQYGWQMEDFDRNIKYARGRERMDLMRNQERATVSYSMQSSRADTQEERFKEQIKWADEEFNRKKKYFEETIRFQERDLQMQKRHFEESHGLTQRQLAEQQAAHQKALAHMQEQWKLEDQRRLIDRQMAIAQKEVQDRAAAASAGAGAQMRKLQEQMDLLREVMERNEAKAKLMNVTGELMVKILEGMILKTTGWRIELDRIVPALETVFSNIQRGINNLRPPSAPPNVPHEQGQGGVGGFYGGGFVDYTIPQNYMQSMRSFAPGGFTGVGMKHEAAGIVHRNEYVVPENGSLVVRGDGQVHLLSLILNEIRDMNRKGLVRATIQTNMTDVPVSEIRTRARTYAHVPRGD